MSDFVKVSELIPGNLYFAGDGWRSTWLYCGRNSSKGFVWYHIGDLNRLAKMPTFEYVNYGVAALSAVQISVTAHNKKVRALTKTNLQYHYANGIDSTQYLCTHTIDMTACTQDRLDYMSKLFYAYNPDRRSSK